MSVNFVGLLVTKWSIFRQEIVTKGDRAGIEGKSSDWFTHSICG